MPSKPASGASKITRNTLEESAAVALDSHAHKQPATRMQRQIAFLNTPSLCSYVAQAAIRSNLARDPLHQFGASPTMRESDHHTASNDVRAVLGKK